MLQTLVRTASLYGAAMVAVTVRRTVARVCLYIVVLVLGLVGLGFLSASAFLALSEALGPAYAALIVGVAYLVGALIALLVALLRRRW